jgi:hypothetical protein
VMRVDTNDLSWFGLLKALLPAKVGWDLYYSHLGACSRDYKLSGRGEERKSLNVTEGSANIEYRGRL